MNDDAAEQVNGEELLDATLTPKEISFCRHYGDVESPSYSRAVESAKRAGYSQSRSAAWKLRQRPGIIRKLAEFQDVARAASQKVLADMEYVRLEALKKGDLAVALRASELAGRHLGLFFDNLAIDLPRQRQLTQDEAVEARRLSALLLADADAPTVTIDPPQLSLPEGLRCPTAPAAPRLMATAQQLEVAEAGACRAAAVLDTMNEREV